MICGTDRRSHTARVYLDVEEWPSLVALLSCCFPWWLALDPFVCDSPAVLFPGSDSEGCLTAPVADPLCSLRPVVGPVFPPCCVVIEPSCPWDVPVPVDWVGSYP
jgi:hypothetical protein